MGRHIWFHALLSSSLLTLSLLPKTYAAANPIHATLPHLTLTTSGIPQNGSALTIHASCAPSSSYNMEYQFWLQTNQGWSMIQDYSSKTSVKIPLKDGSYVVAVYMLPKEAVSTHQWMQAQVKTVVVNVGSHVHLTSPYTGTAQQPLTFQANSMNLIQPVYQFWIQTPTGQWVSSGAYQSQGTFEYVPAEPGTYHVITYAKDPAAPNSWKDSVWSAVHTFTVAPADVEVASITTHLANPLPALNNVNAVLLGTNAIITATVKDAQGNPLADVPVEFTLTNDSNPQDHVTLSQGLSTQVTTNAQGLAQTVLSVTNPEDTQPSALISNSSAVTQITYQVSVPAAPDVLTTGQVLFAAVREKGTVVTHASGPVETTEQLGNHLYALQYALEQQTASSQGEPLSLALSAQFVLPSPTTASTTVTLNQDSGSYGPLATWNPPTITIPQGFSSATVDLSQLDLSRGSTFSMIYTPSDGSAPYVRKITGPVMESSVGIQIPAQESGGTLLFGLSAPSIVDSQDTAGINISKITWRSISGANETIPVPEADERWQTSAVSYTSATPLPSNQAQSYLGSYYNGQASYVFRVPVYPQIGDGVIEESLDNHVISDFLVPSVNNGTNQNVLGTPGAVIPVTPLMMKANPSVTMTSGNAVESQLDGMVEFTGHLQIPGVSVTGPLLHSFAAFVAAPSGPVLKSSLAIAGQQIVVTAKITDAFGNPAPLGTPVKWSVSNPHVLIINQDNEINAEGTAQLILSAPDSESTVVRAQASGYETQLVDKVASGSSLSLTWLPLHIVFTSSRGITYTTSSRNSIISVPEEDLNTRHAYLAGVKVFAGQDTIQGFGLSVSDNGSSDQVIERTNDQGIATWPMSSDHITSQQWTIKSRSNSQGILYIDGMPDAGEGGIGSFGEIVIPVKWQQLGQPSLTWAVSPPQSAAVGTPAAFTVLALNQTGNPFINEPVTFSLLGQQSAKLSTGSAITNAQGEAQVWVSGGTAGEDDTILAQIPQSQTVLSTPLSWVTPFGPSALVPESLQLNASNEPNTLTVNFSRNVDPMSVLANGSQFKVTDMLTGMSYQIQSAYVSGTQVILTLSSSNPAVTAQDGIALQVVPVIKDGVEEAVTDNYQRTAQSNLVTLFSPSSPQITVSAQNGMMNVSIANNGSNIPSGQSVVIMPASVGGSINNMAPGQPDVLMTSSTAALDSWQVPFRDNGTSLVTYSISFDGKTVSILA
ncbi:Ig-like domain-containing protein [Sulfobacillus thermosulfidooxidans]|uniref:Ig-like domain-containing protein n=1 Tax=Sulfobacillus thermosulfidooxidans TaxID=28034 RepID=UPI000363A7DE|nr:Ig-like domain-containing protein [Sulfobacillus thermosulfidooxidans]